MSHDNSTSKKQAAAEHVDGTKGLTHKFAKGTEGGKCLWRGLLHYEVHSCSARYQAVQRAQEDASVYNWPAYKAAAAATEEEEAEDDGGDDGSDGGDGSGGGEEEEEPAFRHFTRGFDTPTEDGKEWDLGKGNFEDATKPYWNQAQHLIPVGLFDASIEALAEEVAESRRQKGKKRLTSGAEVSLYIRESLMEAGYNINHKKNMVLLPMDNAVSDVLHLPRIGGPSGKSDYNAYVTDELEKILDGFRSSFEGLPGEGHLSPGFNALQKDKLEALSDDLYELMTQDSPRGEESE